MAWARQLPRMSTRARFPDEMPTHRAKSISGIFIGMSSSPCGFPLTPAGLVLTGHLKKHTLTRVSPKDRLAGRVKFSPNGKALIYTDFNRTVTTAIYEYDMVPE